MVFGSPCQGLSVAGKGKGFEDPRSGLFLHAVRLLDELRSQGRMPRFAMWENVAGLLTTPHARDYNSALRHFAQLGALDIAWRVLDARFFGVAQRRRRVFTVVDFGGCAAGEVLFEQASGTGNPDSTRASGTPRPNTGPSPSDATGTFGFDVSSAMREGVWQDLCGTLRSSGRHGVCYALTRQQTAIAEELAPTLTVGSRMCVAEDTGELRYLTPVECERLMSWPDDWTARGIDARCVEVTISDTQRYRMTGNGVVSNVAEWIGRRMIGMLD